MYAGVWVQYRAVIDEWGHAYSRFPSFNEPLTPYNRTRPASESLTIITSERFFHLLRLFLIFACQKVLVAREAPTTRNCPTFVKTGAIVCRQNLETRAIFDYMQQQLFFFQKRQEIVSRMLFRVPCTWTVTVTMSALTVNEDLPL